MSIKQEYRMCMRCIMDTNDDPEIRFNSEGNCNYCEDYFISKRNAEKNKTDLTAELDTILKKIIKSGSGKKYDCIVGVSGGADSTYMVYRAKELGLRPLAVHYDNSWNSELSVNNIESLLKKLDIDLYTFVKDWEEFKVLQLSFFKIWIHLLNDIKSLR